jgi:hypothetical protein
VSNGSDKQEMEQLTALGLARGTSPTSGDRSIESSVSSRGRRPLPRPGNIGRERFQRRSSSSGPRRWALDGGTQWRRLRRGGHMVAAHAGSYVTFRMWEACG